MTIEPLYQWFLDQVQLVLLMVFIGLLIYFAYKRAWLGMVGVVVGIAVIGIFIWNPNMLENLSNWFADQFGLNN